MARKTKRRRKVAAPPPEPKKTPQLADAFMALVDALTEHIVQALAGAQAAAREADRDRLLTVREFCKEYRLSVSLFYKLQSEGRAPKVIKVGAKNLISHEAAEQWSKQNERN
jgi:predicted DNA-binding transcriptional regulator AlpA